MKRDEIKHHRVLDIRSKLQKGWTEADILTFCQINLKVSRSTAIKYFEEAAAPLRKKYQEQYND